MGQLDSKLSKEELETLLEAMVDWEAVGNHEYHVMNMVRSMPVPPEDHPLYEYVKEIKDYFTKREKDIKAQRALRQEKAIFIKAKLMLHLRDMSVDQLFDFAQSSPANESAGAATRTEAAPPVAQVDEQVSKRLKLAEQFIQELGVQEYYDRFLREQQS